MHKNHFRSHFMHRRSDLLMFISFFFLWENDVVGDYLIAVNISVHLVDIFLLSFLFFGSFHNENCKKYKEKKKHLGQFF